MSFNTKILKKLDLSGGFTGQWTSKKNKLIIVLAQVFTRFFPDMYVSDGSSINDGVGVFLKPDFSLTDAQNLKNFGYWGNDNEPLYVSQVNYGRMIVVTVDENERTRSLFA